MPTEPKPPSAADVANGFLQYVKSQLEDEQKAMETDPTTGDKKLKARLTDNEPQEIVSQFEQGLQQLPNHAERARMRNLVSVEFRNFFVDGAPAEDSKRLLKVYHKLEGAFQAAVATGGVRLQDTPNKDFFPVDVTGVGSRADALDLFAGVLQSHMSDENMTKREGEPVKQLVGRDLNRLKQLIEDLFKLDAIAAPDLGGLRGSMIQLLDQAKTFLPADTRYLDALKGKVETCFQEAVTRRQPPSDE